jgi:hypothetical protein
MRSVSSGGVLSPAVQTWRGSRGSLLATALAIAACAREDEARAPEDAGSAEDTVAPAGSLNETPCQRELAARGVAFKRAPRETEHPAERPELACVVEDPVEIAPVLRGVTFRPRQIEAAPEPLYAACALGVAIDRMAQMLAERQVTDVVHLGTYGCRVIAGTDMLSEHARARAIDVAALRLEAGAVLSVQADWEKDRPAPATAGGAFLRDLALALFATGVFNVVLTPDFNADHRDHLHLDLTPELRLFK